MRSAERLSKTSVCKDHTLVAVLSMMVDFGTAFTVRTTVPATCQHCALPAYTTVSRL